MRQRVFHITALMIEARGNYSSAGEQAQQVFNSFVAIFKVARGHIDHASALLVQ